MKIRVTPITEKPGLVIIRSFAPSYAYGWQSFLAITTTMPWTAHKIIISTTLAALAGCASTSMPTTVANHFSSARDNAEYSRCMSKHAMFNNRQLMLSPNAVESAWSTCIKQSEIWYPGKNDDQQETVNTGWISR